MNFACSIEHLRVFQDDRTFSDDLSPGDSIETSFRRGKSFVSIETVSIENETLKMNESVLEMTGRTIHRRTKSNSRPS